MSSFRDSLPPLPSSDPRGRRPSNISVASESIASTRWPSPYRELRLWDPQAEEPLIQLDPSIPSDSVQAQQTSLVSGPNLSLRPSLLDLDDPIDLPVSHKSERQIELDHQLAERLHAELNEGYDPPRYASGCRNPKSY